MTDPWDDPEVQAWLQSALDDMVPKMQESSAVVSLVPRGKPDMKIAVEMGMALLLDKPIIAVVDPGTPIPDKLRRAADAIVEGPVTAPDFMQRLTEAMAANMIDTEED